MKETKYTEKMSVLGLQNNDHFCPVFSNLSVITFLVLLAIKRKIPLNLPSNSLHRLQFNMQNKQTPFLGSFFSDTHLVY